MLIEISRSGGDPRAYRTGGWMPWEAEKMKRVVDGIVQRAREEKRELVKPMRALADLVYGNPAVYMLFSEMLTEVPDYPPYDGNPAYRPEIHDVATLLDAINSQIHHPIAYDDPSRSRFAPYISVLTWPMGTKAGFAAFLRDDVNACFRDILEYWGHFLRGPESVVTVTTEEGGWISATAQRDPLNPGLGDFLDTYQVPDPTDPVHYGFASWDQFFTRRFLPGRRPVAAPGDPAVVVSATESMPFAIQRNVRARDTFWAKDQRYSLAHLLGDPEMARRFEGGTVYQAYLSQDSYHNWHAPVAGRYLRPPAQVDGAYYSEPVLWCFSPDQKPVPEPDPGSDARSQGYLSCVAKRAVAFIQPDDPALGLIALVMIGMVEVSSIEFDHLDHFSKGQEIGRFHLGGSSHCLVFGPDVEFIPEPNVVPVDPTHRHLYQPQVPVCSKLGTLLPKPRN